MRVLLGMIVMMGFACPAVAQIADNSRCKELAPVLREKATEAELFRSSARRFALNWQGYDLAKDFTGPELSALAGVVQISDPVSLAVEEYADRMAVAASVMEACAAR